MTHAGLSCVVGVRHPEVSLREKIEAAKSIAPHTPVDLSMKQ